MSRTILCHQSVFTGDSDVFAVDNKVKQELAYNEKVQLYRTLDTSCYHELKSCGFVKVAKGINSFLRIYTNTHNEILIKSNFENKDDKGRRVTYTFYHNSASNPQEICDLLSEHAKLLGMVVNEEDVCVIKQTLMVHLYRKPTYAIVSVLLIILLLSIGKCSHTQRENIKTSQDLSGIIK